MGVDYFPCDRCNCSVCDCGPYVRCDDEGDHDCDRRWCDDACAKLDGLRNVVDEDGDRVSRSCNHCRREDVDDCELLKFLLKHCKLTRKRAVKMLLDKSKRRKVTP